MMISQKIIIWFPHRKYRPYEDQQAECNHEWEMLDLGTGP